MVLNLIDRVEFYKWKWPRMTSPTERTAAWAKTEVGEYNHWINTGPLGVDLRICVGQ